MIPGSQEGSSKPDRLGLSLSLELLVIKTLASLFDKLEALISQILLYRPVKIVLAEKGYLVINHH